VRRVPRRIVSIAAAPGWKARVRDDHEPDGFRVVTLVTWAAVEGEDGATEVVGLVQRAGTPEAPHGRLGFADEVPGFEGYAFTGLVTRAAE
jgi:hypothetical protein